MLKEEVEAACVVSEESEVQEAEGCNADWSMETMAILRNVCV